MMMTVVIHEGNKYGDRPGSHNGNDDVMVVMVTIHEGNKYGDRADNDMVMTIMIIHVVMTMIMTCYLFLPL